MQRTMYILEQLATLAHLLKVSQELIVAGLVEATVLQPLSGGGERDNDVHPTLRDGSQRSLTVSVRLGRRFLSLSAVLSSHLPDRLSRAVLDGRKWWISSCMQ